MRGRARRARCLAGSLPLGEGLLLAAILCLGPTSCSVDRARPGGGRPSPRAVAGLLDLRNWDFARCGPVALRGEWLFAPGKLLGAGEASRETAWRLRSVPDLWKGADAGGRDGRGAGTYFLRVLLPAASPGGKPGSGLAIRYTTVSTAFELDADGVLVAEAGRPSVDAASATPAYRPAVRALPVSTGTLDLVVRVSNHEYRAGGMWRAFELGPEEKLHAVESLHAVLSLGLMGFAIAVAINSLFVFLLRRRERSYLYFALFSVIIALRVLVTGEYLLVDLVPRIGFGLLIRLEYLSAFTPIPLAVLFLSELFPGEIGPRRKLALILPSAPFLVFMAVAPLGFLTRSILVYYPFALATIAGALALIVVKAALRKRPNAGITLVGSIVIGAAGINDMLYSMFVLRTGNLIVFGLAVFIILQAFVLARRFTLAFGSVESLSSELAAGNERLELLVRERTRSLEEAYSTIKELSIRDSLTGVFNRRYLDEELPREAERTLRYGSELSVIFCDLDRFKTVNDRFGHAAGDAVLVAFVRRLADSLRGRVDWIARYGGEEFLVVTPGTPFSAAAGLAERLRARIAEELFEGPDGSIPVTASFGVAGLSSLPGPGDAAGQGAATSGAVGPGAAAGPG
nr:GGDEF domain-containing protein [Treponema sp.]